MGAQAGLNRVEKAMDLKLLEVHPDKCCYLLIEPKRNMNKIKNEINRHPLKYKNSIGDHSVWIYYIGI